MNKRFSKATRLHLEPVFIEIPSPVTSSSVYGVLNGGKLSNTNKGIIRHDIYFGRPRYKLNREEFIKFLDCLERWAQSLIKWRKTAILTMSQNSETRIEARNAIKGQTKIKDAAKTEFIKKYGRIAQALWQPIRHPGTLSPIPFFNPIYFPRKAKDLSYFWRLVDLVNELYMIEPIADTRGRSSKWSEEDYLKIADLWLQGQSDEKIARRFSGPDDFDAIARVKRARLRMKLRRPHKKSSTTSPISN